MSPAALLIIFSKYFKSCVAPLSLLGVYNIINSPSEKRWLLILFCIVICITVPLIWALLSYLTKKYYVKDGNLIFMHGLLNRENTIVPLDRVHSLRTERGIWFRLLDMRGIIFDTLATRQEEIELILDEYEWKRLLAVIEQEEKPQATPECEDTETNRESTVRFSTKNLVLAALCQNHLKGMAVLTSLLALIFGNFNDLSEEQAHDVIWTMESFFESIFSSPLRIAATLAIVYAGILALWLGKTVLRYYDTTMSHDNNIITFTYGLIARASCRFYHERICTVWIKRNFLERHFGFCTLRLRQALNATSQKEDDNMVLYGTDSSSFFLSWWLGKDYSTEREIISAKSGKGVLMRHIALRLIAAAGIGAALIYDELYVWTLIALIYMAIVMASGVMAMRHSRIELMQSYLVVHNGKLAEIANFVKYSNIEVVGIRRTPFTNMTHRVALLLSTTGTTFIVRSLREEDALRIREILLYKSEEQTETQRG